MSATAPRIRRFKRVEYDRMIECGIFQPEDRLELLGGVLVLKEPQSPSHAAGIRRVIDALRAAFGPEWRVDGQLPIALDDDSEPEPDISVVPVATDLYESGHPSAPLLLVEVALTRLAFNRRNKGGLYARAGVPEYWIVNLIDRVVEVQRAPQPSRGTRYGWQYSDIRVLRADDAVAPIVAPTAVVRVADLLPSR